MLLKHIPTGLEGKFVKRYHATGHGELIQIRLFNNGIYYAPASEFIEI